VSLRPQPFRRSLLAVVNGEGELSILERWRRMKAILLEEHEKNIYARKEEDLSQIQVD